MTMSFFEYKLTKLDRQVLATSVANKNLVTQRLRHLGTANESMPAPRAPFFEGDDLLFDNVPI